MLGTGVYPCDFVIVLVHTCNHAILILHSVVILGKMGALGRVLCVKRKARTLAKKGRSENQFSHLILASASIVEVHEQGELQRKGGMWDAETTANSDQKRE
mmetsp:Transcript_10624/g.27805  ORF Transcript_10624/g.27805 Transcript_10624/m.27805 type:complete len:101 (+) Transcript_10624:66-368(+)